MIESIASPTLWVVTLGAVLGLLALDFAMTRRPHAVRMREAAAWSAFYLAIALSFGAFVWGRFGADAGTAYLTGYLVERSLSVDNLFLFMLLLSAFAVPAHLQQRVLLYGIVGALVLRGAFIALGAVALAAFDWTFLAFGVLLLLTAGRILRGALRGTEHAVKPDQMRSVRLVRRFVPVTPDYKGTRLLGRVDGRRALTPLALTVAAVIGTDIVFAIDSVPAVYGITEDPYLVFAANAFALLGLRALYFLLAGSLSKLVYLNFGLAAILAFIGTKLALHWAHVQWPSVPQVPDQSSIVVVTAILAVTTLASLRASRRNRASEPERPNAAADAPSRPSPTGTAVASPPNRLVAPQPRQPAATRCSAHLPRRPDSDRRLPMRRQSATKPLNAICSACDVDLHEFCFGHCGCRNVSCDGRGPGSARSDNRSRVAREGHEAVAAQRSLGPTNEPRLTTRGRGGSARAGARRVRVVRPGGRRSDGLRRPARAGHQVASGVAETLDAKR